MKTINIHLFPIISISLKLFSDIRFSINTIIIKISETIHWLLLRESCRIRVKVILRKFAVECIALTRETKEKERETEKEKNKREKEKKEKLDTIAG